jgi:hypothetical protein
MSRLFPMSIRARFTPVAYGRELIREYEKTPADECESLFPSTAFHYNYDTQVL